MGIEVYPELRGFDSYELKLGDELRGERASLGKTLLDVQRDLKIKAEYLDAVENADASAFPVASFAAGYVKSYARYLSLDGDDVFRRFCEESGFRGPLREADPLARGAAPTAGFAKGADAAAARRVADLSIDTKYLGGEKSTLKADLGAGARGLVSVAMMAALVAGLGYGGWNMLKNLQRVGFAPMPSAPEVHVSSPDFHTPATGVAVASDLDAEVTLAAIYAAQEIAGPAVEPRDGPISSIDPAHAGIYAPPSKGGSPVRTGISLSPEDDLGAVDASLIAAAARVEAGDLSADQSETTPFSTHPGVHVLATADAWVRVRDARRSVLFSGILGAGERFTLPDGADAAQLRAGNAGAVYILIDGSAYGPLGDGPAVAKNVSLAPDDVRSVYPAVENVAAFEHPAAPIKAAAALTDR